MKMKHGSYQTKSWHLVKDFDLGGNYLKVVSLQDPKLYVNALIHAIRHGVDNKWHCSLRDCLKCNQTLQGAQRDGNDFSILGCASHEDRA